MPPRPAYLKALDQAIEAQEAERKARGQRVSAAQERVKAATPNPEAAVTLAYPRQRNRWLRVTVISGPQAEVEAYAAHVLATATCTQYYEHMLPYISDCQPAEGERPYSITLTESMYAGD